VADTYANFDELSRNETAGVDYRILLRQAGAAFAIVAPHGGGIEPGTSELADAAAGDEHSFYAFLGLKRSGNAVLHVTATHFDEPLCLTVIARSGVVVTLHGEHGTDDGEGVFLGGLDDALGQRVRAALEARGFEVRRHPDPGLQGREPTNLCNRGTSGRGVQLELSRAVREQMFESLTREGRQHRKPRFDDFAGALRAALLDAC